MTVKDWELKGIRPDGHDWDSTFDSRLNEFQYAFLRDHAPMWLDRLAKIVEFQNNFNMLRPKTVGKQVLNISEYGSCIVGECHGWDGKYIIKCQDCVDYSNDFYDAVDAGNEDNFKSTLSNFITHFQECHEKEMVSCPC